MITKSLLAVSPLLLIASVAAVRADGDCVIPSRTWRLELVSLESVDGVPDTSAEVERLGSTASLHGDFSDKQRPNQDPTTTLRGNSVDGQAWQLRLREVSDE